MIPTAKPTTGPGTRRVKVFLRDFRICNHFEGLLVKEDDHFVYLGDYNRGRNLIITCKIPRSNIKSIRDC
jgi:hypothetical protein